MQKEEDICKKQGKRRKILKKGERRYGMKGKKIDVKSRRKERTYKKGGKEEDIERWEKEGRKKERKERKGRMKAIKGEIMKKKTDR